MYRALIELVKRGVRKVKRIYASLTSPEAPDGGDDQAHDQINRAKEAEEPWKSMENTGSW